jgi:hypothetical protein
MGLSIPNHRHPAFRIRELIGPEFRSNFGEILAERLHLEFDVTAQEEVPAELRDLISRLDCKP